MKNTVKYTQKKIKKLIDKENKPFKIMLFSEGEKVMIFVEVKSEVAFIVAATFTIKQAKKIKRVKEAIERMTH